LNQFFAAAGTNYRQAQPIIETLALGKKLRGLYRWKEAWLFSRRFSRTWGVLLILAHHFCLL